MARGAHWVRLIGRAFPEAFAVSRRGKTSPWFSTAPGAVRKWAAACFYVPNLMGGPMTNDAKQKKEPKGSDQEQFQRFIEAARKRDMNESLGDFAARFGKSSPPKPEPKK